MKKRPILRIILIILGIIVILPVLYLAYDRIIMPPAPSWQIPPSYGNMNWEQSAKNYLANYNGENALQYYMKAYPLADNHRRTKDWDAMDKAVSEDRIGDLSAVDKVLVTNQEAINETLQGTKLKTCQLPPMPYSFATPVPDYLRVQILTKFIILQGLKLEQENRYSDALDCYLAGMQFGKDMGQKDQPLISRLISIAVINKSLKPIARLIRENRLSESEYRKIIEETERIEKEQGSITDAFEFEYRMVYTEFYNLKPVKAAMVINTNYEGKPRLGDYLFAGYIFMNRGHILRDTKELYTGVMSDVNGQPFPKFLELSKTRKIPGNLITKMSMLDFTSSLTRQYLEINKLRLVRINAATRLYQLKKNQWPNSLEELKPDFLTDIPKDILGDTPFHWSMTSEGPAVYSVGPDITDNSLQLMYDPTNGTLSKGDLVS